MDWAAAPIFELLQQGGRIAPDEMARTFNCGIGMAVVVAGSEVAHVTSELEGAGEKMLQIGRIEAGQRGCTVTGPNDSWTATHNA